MSKASNTAYILGYPVAHSRSPLIHNHWLEKYGLEGAYGRKELAPEELNAFITQLTPQNFAGGNVTIPHKEHVFKVLEHVTPQAEKLKAVNTLYWEGEKLIGDNTDGYGFIAHLKTVRSADLSKIKKAMILGAGGAARPIIHSLITSGVNELKIANRTRSRAEQIASELASPKSKLQVIEWEDISQHVADCDLIVNTTSLGMTGQQTLEIDLAEITPGTCVYDIVYVPIKTDFLKQAEAHQAIIIDGLGMLLHQAVPGFEKWFGVRPEVTQELRDIILADLEQGK